MDRASDTAFVTGGRGFIGRHIVAALRQAGYRAVTAGPARPGDHADHQPTCGPEDLPGLTRILRAARPGLVVHLAAAPPPVDADAQHRVTVAGTRCLLAAIDAAGLDPLLLAMGSAAEFGAARLPAAGLIADDHPCAPETPHGHAKHAASRLVMARAAAGGRCSVLRLFTAAGPAPPPYSLLGSLSAQLRGLPRAGGVVRVHGPDRMRDYLSVAAIADAVLALARHRGALPPAINLCSGRSVSVRDWAEAMAAAHGIAVRLEVRADGPRAADPARVVGDPRLLRRLGVIPEAPSLPHLAAAIMAPPWAG